MQQRAINTKAAILDAGTKLFARHGFAATSVEMIAAEAQVNKQRIYAYFASKKGLFEAVLCAGFSGKSGKLCSETTLAELRRAPEKLTPLLLKEFFLHHRSNPVFWRLLAWANLEKTDLAKLNGIRAADNAMLREIFEAAKSRGCFAGVDFETYLFSLFALSSFYLTNGFTLQYTLGNELFTEAGFEKLCRQLPLLFR